MRIGVFLPTKVDGRQPTADQVAEQAIALEEAGIDGIWSLDNLAPEGQPRPDPMTWLLTACLATRSIEVGTSIYVVSSKNPVELAQRILTIEQLVPGRFTYGVGAGSTREALEAPGSDFDRRFELLHDHMDTLQRLCRGETVGAAAMHPPEDLAPPRFMLGAWHSPTSLRHAVSDHGGTWEYDGWIASGSRTPRGIRTSTLDLLADSIKRYHDLGGHKRACVSTVTFDFTEDAGRLANDESFSLRCPPAEASDRLKRLEDLGYDDIFVMKNAISTKDLDQLRALVPKDSRPYAR